MTKSIKGMCALCLVTLLTLAVQPALAGTIEYRFDSNSAAVTKNDFAGDGVTASNTVSGGLGSIASNRWQRKLLDRGTATMSFTITIPAGVRINLTEIVFVDGIDSTQGPNQIYSRWDLTVSTGSVSPSSGTRTLTGTGFTSGSNNVTLSGLEGLTDTTVTFSWLVNFGVTIDFSGSGNNNYRHAFLDDVVLHGEIPGPSGTLLILK